MLYLFKLTPHLVDRLGRGASSYSRRSGKAGHGVTATKSCCAIERHWQACMSQGIHPSVTPKRLRHTHNHTHTKNPCPLGIFFLKQTNRKKSKKSESHLKTLKPMFDSHTFLFLTPHCLKFTTLFFKFGFEKCVATCPVLNVIWELSEWRGEWLWIPRQPWPLVTRRQEMDSHFGGIQFSRGPLWKRLNHVDIWGVI